MYASPSTTHTHSAQLPTRDGLSPDVAGSLHLIVPDGHSGARWNPHRARPPVHSEVMAVFIPHNTQILSLSVPWA